MSPITNRMHWALSVALCTLTVTAVSVDHADAAPPLLDPCDLNPSLCFDFCDLNPDACPDSPAPAEGQADLKIMDLFVDLRDGDCVVIATVENQGTGDAGSFDLDVFLDRSVPPEIGELSAFYVTHPGIAAGSTADVLMPVPTGFEGATLNLSALVDSTRTVEEANEGNNLWYRCGAEWLGCLI